MNSASTCFELLTRIVSDNRLNVWHLALLNAIVQLAYKQNENYVIRVSRNRLMKLSHIGTAPTYHKYFKQLQQLGYIQYFPSYHPGYKSVVKLKIPIDDII